MNPGAMNEQVAIQASTPTTTDAGGQTNAWADVSGWDTLWAEIKPLSGFEQIRAMQTAASATHRVRMYAVEGVKSTLHRLRRHRDDGIMHIIAPPTYDRMRFTMELLVREHEVAT